MTTTSDIFVVRGTFERDFVILSRHTAQDDALSWAARGVLTYLLSLPEGWRVNLTELQTHGDIGRDALRRVMRELEGRGYLARQNSRGRDGRMRGNVFFIYGAPSLNPNFGKT